MKLLQSPIFWILAVVLLVAGVALFLRSRGDRAWGFKDVVKDPGYWDDAAEALAQAKETANDAKAWDDATVSRAVTAYLFDTTSSRDAWMEKRKLEGLGHRTHAQVLELLADTGRYPQWVAPTGKDILPEAPFHRACELLGDTPPAEAIPLLAPFLDDKDKSIRQAAASTLGGTGTAGMVPLLRRALVDSEDYVRRYALSGLLRARKTGRLTPEAAEALFEDVRQLVEKEDNGDQSAELLLALDAKRAEEVFLSPGIFRTDSRILHEALKAMADGNASVPRERLLQVISPLRQAEIKYPKQYLLGQALRLLGRHRHPEDQGLLESLQQHKEEEIVAGASQGLLAWHGVEGFEQRLWDREEKEGYDSLSRPQQHYRAVFILYAEIDNGGLEQYFVNSSGNHWRDAMEGLRAMKAGKHLGIFEQAVTMFGKDGPATDRRTRQEQLARIARRDEKAFDPLHEQYHDIDESIEVLSCRYVLANPEAFR